MNRLFAFLLCVFAFLFVALGTERLSVDQLIPMICSAAMATVATAPAGSETAPKPGEDAGAAGGDPDPNADKGGADPGTPGTKLSLTQRITAARSAWHSRGTAAEVTALKGELAKAKDAQAKLTAQVAQLTTERDAARKELADAEAAMADFNGAVINESTRIAEQAGVPPAKLPTAGTGTGAPTTRAELEERMKGKSLAECAKMLREFKSSNN